MTKDELIVELTGRIDQGITHLQALQNDGTAHEFSRLQGKIQGLLLVKDWLRSY